MELELEALLLGEAEKLIAEGILYDFWMEP